MDYGELLYKAQENEKKAGKQDVRCYKSGYSPPKKLQRTVSSANVRKFLERKENEEKQKMQEAKKKKEELLALRNQDKKAKRRVEFMLKRTKSANYSVMDDAIDNNNTADTLCGPMQCDEDDYGYVSQEASALYAKLMNKYNSMPAEPSLFSKAKKEVKDLSAAKDRVRAALKKEEEEAEMPHKRKRKHKDKDDELQDEDVEDDKSLNDRKDAGKSKEKLQDTLKKKNQNAPPPPSFHDLLKLAEEKKGQPVDIEKLKKNMPKEPDRPMTQKEKMEYMREQERRINRERREKGLPPLPSQFSDSSKGRSGDKAQKINQKPVKPEISPNNKVAETKSDSHKKVIGEAPKKLNGEAKKLENTESERVKSDKLVKRAENRGIPKKPVDKSRPVEKKSAPKEDDVDLADIDREIELLKRKRMLLEKNKASNTNRPPVPTTTVMPSKSLNSSAKPSLERSKASGPQPSKPKTMLKVPSATKEPLRPAGASNVSRPSHLPPKKNQDKNRKPMRRIASDSEEYDSELEDFIDDDEEGIDYSSHIKEIFGYDRSRYANVDDDDECMESNFAQQQREEFVSTKIGIMEDLEDIRKEQEEKKRLKAKKLAKLKASRNK